MCRLLYFLVLLVPAFLAGASAQNQDNSPASNLPSQQSVGGNWFAERTEQLARNQPADALTLSQQALAFFADNPDPQAHGRVLNASAYALYFLGRYGESMQYARDAELLAEQQQLAEVHARALMLQGNVLQDIGEYPQAIRKYQQAADYYRESGNRLYEGYCYNNMANTYEKAGQYKTALKYYQRYRGFSNDSDSEAGADFGTANALLALGETTQAIIYYRKSLKLYENENDHLGKALALNGFGDALLAKGDINEALKLFDQTLEFSKNNDLEYVLLYSLKRKAEAMLKQGDLKQAENYIMQAKESASQKNSKSELANILTILSDIYQQQGQLQLALKTLKSAQELEKQYLSERSSTQLAVMQALFDSETKAAHIEQLEQQNQLLQLEQEVSRQNTRNARLMSAMLFGALGLITLWAVHIFRERQRLRRLAAELKAARQQAEAAAETKAAFLANMSHEIRTPINAVMGLSRLALDTGSVQDKKTHLNKILDAGNTLLRLVDDILDFSRIEAGKLHIDPVVMEPKKVLQSAINMNAVQAHDKGLSFITDIDATTPARVIGDPWRIQQILVNLISNAVKFTSHGHISVSVRESNQASNSQPMLRFSVSDTGIGMSQKQQQRLFQSFTQGDDSITRQYGGTGLGLAICKQLCKLMGGEIWVESEVGKGSTFCFTLPLKLPLHESDADTGQSAPAPNPPGDYSGYSLLLVDDNSINCEVARGMLSKTGINIEVVTNGLLALEKLQEQSFDLILMDIQMPGLDGLSATRKIRSELKLDTPIIAMTAHALASDRQKSQQAGMNDHLAKPIEPVELYSMLQRHLPERPTAGKNRPSTTDIQPLLVTETHNRYQPSTDELPASLSELAELDTNRALQRLAGNTALYLKLVSSFRRDQRHSATRIRRMLANDDQQGLFRAIHALKSSFAYIGAFELSESCQVLETRLQHQQQCGDGISELCRKLDSLLSDLAPCDADRNHHEGTLSQADLIGELEKIIPMLKQSDLSAEERLEALQPNFTDEALAARFEQLRCFAREVEFEQAARLAEDILSRLQAISSQSGDHTDTNRDENSQ